MPFVPSLPRLDELQAPQTRGTRTTSTTSALAFVPMGRSPVALQLEKNVVSFQFCLTGSLQRC